MTQTVNGIAAERQSAHCTGSLYVVAAPSGAGKTTLVKMLLARMPEVKLSISCTTRAPRPGEQDGREYHFIAVERFREMIGNGDFLEWAEVHGNYYGTSKSWISERLNHGEDVLLEIDWQGAQQVRNLFPQAVGIFVLPPSMEELARRLTGRGTDSAEVIARRLAAAQTEMSHAGEFDYVIINDRLEQALDELGAVVGAARLRLDIQRARHADLFEQMTRI